MNPSTHVALISASLAFTVIPFAIKWYLEKKKREFKYPVDEKAVFQHLFTYREPAPKTTCTIGDITTTISCKPAYLEKVLMFLYSSQVTLDLCMNHLSMLEYVDVIVKAHRRGVTIRVILDTTMNADDYKRQKQTTLIGAGIPVKMQSSKVNIMHHKFCIVDNKVMFGSMNMTNQALCRNFENVTFTNDIYIVERFKEMFNEMWDAFPL